MVSIPNIVNIFSNWVVTLQQIWDILSTPLASFLDPLAVSFPPMVVVSGILSIMGVYHLTLLEFMLGAGLAIYIGYQLCIWLLNLVT